MADKLGERYSKEKGCLIKYFPAHWDNLEKNPVVVRRNRFGQKYNAAAGYIRNNDMMNYIKNDGILIALWDGVSKGTKQMINLCKQNNVTTYVVKF